MIVAPHERHNLIWQLMLQSRQVVLEFSLICESCRPRRFHVDRHDKLTFASSEQVCHNLVWSGKKHSSRLGKSQGNFAFIR